MPNAVLDGAIAMLLQQGVQSLDRPIPPRRVWSQAMNEPGPGTIGRSGRPPRGTAAGSCSVSALRVPRPASHGGAPAGAAGFSHQSMRRWVHRFPGDDDLHRISPHERYRGCSDLGRVHRIAGAHDVDHPRREDGQGIRRAKVAGENGRMRSPRTARSCSKRTAGITPVASLGRRWFTSSSHWVR